MRNNNQKVIRKLSARSMKKNRMRNLFAIGAICLTSLLFTAVFSMGIGMGQVFQEQTMMEVGGKFHAGYYCTGSPGDFSGTGSEGPSGV